MFEEIIDACLAGGVMFTLFLILFLLSAFCLLLTFIRFRFLEIEFMGYLKKNNPEVLLQYQQRKTWLKIIHFLKEVVIARDKHILQIKRKAGFWNVIGQGGALMAFISFVGMLITIITSGQGQISF